MLTGMPWPSTLPPHRILRAPILTRVRACAWPGADDGEADGGATDGGAAGRAAGSAAGGVSGGARSGAAAGGATGSAAGSRVATKRTKPEDMVSPDRPAPRSRVSWADVTRSPQRTPATHVYFVVSFAYILHEVTLDNSRCTKDYAAPRTRALVPSKSAGANAQLSS